MFGLFGTFGLVFAFVLGRDVLVAGLMFGTIGLAMWGVALGFATAGYRERRRQDGRGERLRAWAAANGWYYTDRVPDTAWLRSMAETTNELTMYRMVSRPIAGLTVTLAAGTCMRMRYMSAEEHAVLTPVTVAVVSLGPGWPEVRVRPIGPMREFGAWAALRVGLINDRSEIRRFRVGYPPFDERFEVAGRNQAVAPVLLTRPLMDLHVAGRVESWDLSGGELRIVSYDELEPTSVPWRAHQVREVAGLLGPARR